MITIGIDTSNYTTSIAALDNQKIIHLKKILPVKQGERGLRQSNALFLHVKQLPELFRYLSKNVSLKDVSAIGVSTRPRNIEGSYMPVFLAGEGYAKVLADALDLPLYMYSHQDGHIMSGIHTGGFEHLLEKQFLSVHLSGGTTEILLSEYCGNSFKNIIVGGTRDISAGQFIDRVGVALGMNFPCGHEMEILADEDILHNNKQFPISVDGSYINFSGVETRAYSLLNELSSSLLAGLVFKNIGESLAKALNYAISQYSIRDILVVGGVASNKIIKEFLVNNVSGQLYFTTPEYSTDNAVGVASLAWKGFLDGYKSCYSQPD